MVIITRKIQLLFAAEDSSEVKALFKTIYAWQRICQKAGNYIVNVHFVQDNIKEFFFLIDDVKMKLGSIQKDPAGILTTSSQNTSYQGLSKRYKGECPMGMLAGLNNIVYQNYKKEAKDVLDGKRSLRCYKQDIPLPIRKADIRGFTKLPDGNYLFTVYGITFRTFFGRDSSRNQQIFDSAVAGQYRLCDSSISIKKTKLFFNATFEFEKERRELDENKVCTAELDLKVPIKGAIGDWSFMIGTKREYLHRRLAIQGALRQQQIGARFNRGGKGRKVKLKGIEHYRNLEHNYVETRIHQYTSKLVDICLKNGCGTLVLVNQISKEEEAKKGENKEFLLKNWGYYGMKIKLEQKCSKYGIKIIVQ